MKKDKLYESFEIYNFAKEISFTFMQECISLFTKVFTQIDTERESNKQIILKPSFQDSNFKRRHSRREFQSC